MSGPRPVNPYIDVEIQYVDTTWHSLGGEITNLEFSRGNNNGITDEFEIGTLSLDIAGGNWSPATNANVRPGRPIRIKGLDNTSTWQTIWAGTLETPIVTFNTKSGTQTTRFTGYDAVGRADRALHATGIHAQGSLTTQLNAAKVAKSGYRAFSSFSVIDSSGYSQTFASVTATGDPTVREMINRVRNNFIDQVTPGGDNFKGAEVWAKRDDPAGFKALGYDADVTPGFNRFFDLPDPLSPDAVIYTDIQVGHTGETFKNAVTLNFAAGSTFGPYVDLTTTADWDRRDGDVDMINNTALGLAASSADYWLQRQPAPTIQARSVTFNVLDNRAQLAAERLYSLMDIRLGSILPGGSPYYRPIRETHRVTPRSWFCTYDLKNGAQRVIAAPTLVP